MEKSRTGGPSVLSDDEKLVILHTDAVNILAEHATLLRLEFWLHAYPGCPATPADTNVPSHPGHIAWPVYR